MDRIHFKCRLLLCFLSMTVLRWDFHHVIRLSPPAAKAAPPHSATLNTSFAYNQIKQHSPAKTIDINHGFTSEVNKCVHIKKMEALSLCHYEASVPWTADLHSSSQAEWQLRSCLDPGDHLPWVTPFTQINHIWHIIPKISGLTSLSAAHSIRTEEQAMKKRHQLPAPYLSLMGIFLKRSIIFSPEHNRYQIWPNPR